MKITSIHNKKILHLRKLYKSRERKSSDVFLVEGVKEVLRGIDSGFLIDSIYYSPEILKQDVKEAFKLIPSDIEIFELDRKVYEKLAYRVDTEGIIALFKKKKYSLEEIDIGNESLFIILESIEKPGNLGAILRTADAAGVDAVILTETKVDQYHPNVIRSSIGAAFNVPVISSSNNRVAEWLSKNSIEVYSAALPAYVNIYNLNLKGNIALVFGTESKGLSDIWLEEDYKIFTIPMTGIVDSLNVSVSVAVSLFEAVRQRI